MNESQERRYADYEDTPLSQLPTPPQDDVQPLTDDPVTAPAEGEAAAQLTEEQQEEVKEKFRQAMADANFPYKRQPYQHPTTKPVNEILMENGIEPSRRNRRKFIRHVRKMQAKAQRVEAST